MGGELSAEIDAAYEREGGDNWRSTRIGASIISNPCEAFLAFAVRGFPQATNSPRSKRIFRDGHRIEDAVIQDLKKAGHTIHDIDPMTGKQYKWDKVSGYLVYKADGIIEAPDGTSMLLEVKSMKASSWRKFKKKGVLISHPGYYDQMQMGMGMSGYRKAVVIAYNKDTSEYWDEVIEFDDIRYYNLLHHGEVGLSDAAMKVATDPTDWRCKTCSRFAVCWQNAPVEQDMRTCNNAVPAQGGWNCVLGCVGTCQSWRRYEPKPRIK